MIKITRPAFLVEEEHSGHTYTPRTREYPSYTIFPRLSSLDELSASRQKKSDENTEKRSKMNKSPTGAIMRRYTAKHAVKL